MAIKIYSEQYVGMLPDIYSVNSAFVNTFGGGLQIVDGIRNTDTFMNLKTIDTAVTLNDYSTDANVGFGTGTGSTSRFGNRTEIKAVNTQVEYESPLAIHEGIDRMTINDDFDAVIAERLVKHGERWTEYINGLLGKAISYAASETIEGALDEAGVVEAFRQAAIKLTNNKINKALTRRAYVTPEVYNIIVESKLATTAKNSSANIDANEIVKFKGFVVEELADEYFQDGEHVYFAVDNVGVAGVGVEVVRTFESEDFAGVALQGAAKFAKFIPESAKKGILKAKLATGA